MNNLKHYFSTFSNDNLRFIRTKVRYSKWNVEQKSFILTLHEMKSTIKFNMNLQFTKRIPWQKVLFESLKRIKNHLIWFLCQHFGMQTLVRVLFFAIQNI